MKRGFGIFLILALLVFNIYLNTKGLEDSQAQVKELQEQIKQLRTDQKQLQEHVKSFIDKWNVEVFEVTAYAPLDPLAKEGMCFSGDPEITASGARVVPGVTLAASRSIPFGTRMYIQGHGWRVVQDRGGLITENKVDIAVQTREEALKIGRRKAVVVWAND